MSTIYFERFAEVVERNRPRIPEVREQLEAAGVKYVMAAWIDLRGIPKTKPVPWSTATCRGPSCRHEAKRLFHPCLTVDGGGVFGLCRAVSGRITCAQG